VRRLTRIIAAIAVASALAGCGSGHRWVAFRGHGHSQITNGIVYGTVFGSGGPRTFPPRKMDHIPMKNVTVIATRDHLGTKFQAITSNHGTFSLSIPPGTYVLTSECGSASPAAVRMRPGTKVERNIDCEFV
jgi:hypothetical protein